MTPIHLAKIKDLINQIPNDLIVEDIKIFPYHIEVKITGRVDFDKLTKEWNSLESNPSLDPFDHPSSQDPTNPASNKILEPKNMTLEDYINKFFTYKHENCYKSKRSNALYSFREVQEMFKEGIYKDQFNY